MAQLRIKIVFLDAGAELDLLDLARRRFRVGVLLLLLVNVLAEIHDTADGGLGVGRDLDEIETDLNRQLERLFRLKNAELLALGTDHANLRDLDAMIATDVRKRVVVTTLILARAVAATGGRKRISHQ